jgi:phage/plasmid-like protein (TIGR03299 family)
MRTSTWNGIGTSVKTATTVEEVLANAGLDYTVHKEPIMTQSGIIIPDKVATVRDDGRPIGVVSKTYEILQNADAFGFVNDVPGIQFEKAGETKTGMVYLIGKLPDTTVLGDTFTPHLIFQTSHNGRYNVRATICPLRIVCQNQFAYSFKQMRNTIDIRHSRLMPTKIAQAQQLIADTAIYMQGFSDTAEELAMLKLNNPGSVYQIIDAFFESTKEITEIQKKHMQEKKDYFIKCYEADDNANFVGTGWGVVNAFSDFNSHGAIRARGGDIRRARESQFMAVTFDTDILKLMGIIRANSMAA